MNKHYRSFNDYIKERFGRKLYKLSLSVSDTCPNRDGTVGVGGCIFCSGMGSGDFAQSASLDVKTQISLAKEKVKDKCKNGSYIAYFQSFTSTYCDHDKLKNALYCALEDESVYALSIATRPDTLPNDVLSLLKDAAKIKPLFVELGLQSSKEESIKYIRRGYDNGVYAKAAEELHKIGAEVVTHMIIGLPGEDLCDMLATAKFISDCKSDGIKLQLLHVLRGTDLAKDFEKGLFQTLTKKEYIDIIGTVIEHLPPDMVIHRITGDGPKKILISPLWSADKKDVMNSVSKEFDRRNVVQGKFYK